MQWDGDDLPNSELLTWSNSITDDQSLDCARDPEIPTAHPTVFFVRALLR